MPADAPDKVIESVADVAVRSDQTAAYLAGTYRPGPGQPGVAVVWTSDGRERTGSVELDRGGADEAWARGVATRDATVVVAGATRTGDSTVGVLWQSDDAGATFGPPQVLDENVTTIADVAFADQGFIAVGETKSVGSPATAVALIGSGASWTPNALGGPEGSQPESLTVEGATVLVTGSIGLYSSAEAVLWVSADTGTTFTSIDMASGYQGIGPVTSHDGTYVISALGKEGEPMAILTSTDGVTWVATEAVLDWSGESFGSTGLGGSSILVDSDGRYVADATGGWGFMATISPDGKGEMTSFFSGRLQADENALLFQLGDQMSAVSNTERSFCILSRSGSEWEYTGPVSAQGPPVVWADVGAVGSAVAVMTTAYPKVTDQGSNHRPVNMWSRFDDAEFVPSAGKDVPPSPSAWTGNDTTEVALYYVDDPGDVEETLESGGVGARMRPLPDGEWSEQELILTGPGADELMSIDRLGTGFVAVGSRTSSNGYNDQSATPVVIEYSDQGWTLATLPTIEGSEVYLRDVVAAPDGTALATGTTNRSGPAEPVALARGADGVWSEVELPIDGAVADILSREFTDGKYHLLIKEGNSHAVLTSPDAKTFVRTDLQFPDPFISEARAATSIAGVTYVVGTSGSVGARRIAVWEVGDDGSLTPVAISGDAPIGNIEAKDVLTIGDAVWVTGLNAGLGLAWRLDGLGTGSVATTPPATAASTTPAATTAPATTAAS